MILQTDLNGKKGFFVPIAEMKSLLEMMVVRDDECESLAKTLASQITLATPSKEMNPQLAERGVKAMKPGPKPNNGRKVKPTIKDVESPKTRRKRGIKRAVKAQKRAAKAA